MSALPPVAMPSPSSGSQRVVPGAAASPGNTLQVQSLRPASDPLSQKLGNVLLAAGVLTSPADESDALSSSRPTAPWERMVGGEGRGEGVRIVLLSQTLRTG